MNRRIGVLGALVTLVALSAYFAEGVRASMCLPGMDMDMAVAGSDANPHAGMNHGPADDSSTPRTDMPECPRSAWPEWAARAWQCSFLRPLQQRLVHPKPMWRVRRPLPASMIC